MKRFVDIVLIASILGLILLAALSGVWMKKPEKKDKDDGKPDVNVYVIVPPVAAPPETSAAPDAKHYSL